MKKLLSSALLAASFNSFAVPIYTEPTGYDSGSYPTYISSNTEIMYGKIGGTDSYDTYSFQWDGGQLVANTFGNTDFDSVLWLYNNSGLLFNLNDNAYPSTDKSQFVSFLPSGIYQIKITSNDFLNVPTDYQINRNVSHNGHLVGITPVQEFTAVNVPEPGIVYLMLVGGLFMVMFVKRK